MEYPKKFVQTTRGKLIVSFVLVLCISLFTWIVNSSAFKEINDVVKRLSKPNEKLEALNHLQLNITRSIEYNRVEALQDRMRPSEDFEKKSAEIKQQISVLKNIFATSPGQVARLEQVDSIFDKREYLFKKYLEIRYNYIHNNIYDNQFEELAGQVEKESTRIDSNVVTTEKQTKTYTLLSPETGQKQKRKKGKFTHNKNGDSLTEGPKVMVEEKLDIKIDTLVVSQKKDSVLQNIRSSLNNLETERNKGRQFLKKQELLLIQSNEMLLDRLLGLVEEAEQEERALAEQNSAESIRISERTLTYTRVLTFIFIITACVLIGFIIWDVSRMNTYRKELERSKAEAEYHSEAKQRFLSNMSHEIRTPLQTILGFSELMAREKKFDPKKAATLASSSRHLLQVVNEILDYSRIVSGKFTIEEQDVHLEELLKEINETADFLCRQKNLGFSFELNDLNPDGTWVRADPFRIKQVLLNIIGNAVKYTEKGGIRFSVSIKDQRDRYAVKMQVADTGIGMEPADLERIFQQFEQAETSHYRSGTGLGLSIVKELLDAMKGSIQVKSEPGKGSSFDMALFLPKAIPAEKTTAIQVPVLPHFTGRAWVVDDDPLILQLSAVFLQQQHLSYACFTSAEALLATAWDPEVKIVFTDIRLPGMNGMELCRQLRALYGPGLRVVALTAQAMPESKDEILMSGFDDIIYKPFTADDLYFQVERVAGKNEDRDMHEGEFDLSMLRAMMGDGKDLENIRQQFVSDSTADIGAIEKNMEIKDRDALLMLVHRIGGRFAQMGSRTLATALQALEQDLEKAPLKEKDLQILNDLLPRLKNAVGEMGE